MTTMLFDTHCHLDVYPDPVGVLTQAQAAGIHVVAVTEDPGRFRLLRTRLGRRSGIQFGIGLHPLRVTNRYRSDLDRLSRLLPDADWIGEVGLDFSKAGAATKTLQMEAFEALLAIDAVLRKPITVHSRGAERDTVTRLLQTNAVGVLHWYTGSLAVADQAVNGGLWFSVNPAMVRSSRASGLLRMIPPHHVVLETDGPFARCDGRPAHPTDLPTVAGRLADIWNLPREAALEQVATNQQRLTAMLRPKSD